MDSVNAPDLEVMDKDKTAAAKGTCGFLSEQSGIPVDLSDR